MKKKIFENIQREINNLYYHTDFYVLNLVLIVNKRLHLVKDEKRVIAFRKLGFLFNYAENPQKALKVISKMKSLFESWARVTIMTHEEEEFYFTIMMDCVTHNFKNDDNSRLYVESLIKDIRRKLKLAETC